MYPRRLCSTSKIVPVPARNQRGDRPLTLLRLHSLNHNNGLLVMPIGSAHTVEKLNFLILKLKKILANTQEKEKKNDGRW